MKKEPLYVSLPKELVDEFIKEVKERGLVTEEIQETKQASGGVILEVLVDSREQGMRLWKLYAEYVAD